MREKFVRFMYGRYGLDQFSRTLSFAAIGLMVVSTFVRSNILYLVSLAAFIYVYFRVFSKNHAKRYQENQKYLQTMAKLRERFGRFKRTTAQRKTHHIYKCPVCRQKIRIPRGKGKIEITCPKCQAKFIKRS